MTHYQIGQQVEFLPQYQNADDANLIYVVADLESYGAIKVRALNSGMFIDPVQTVRVECIKLKAR